MRRQSRWILFVGLVLLGSGVINGAVPFSQDSFDKANRLYEQGNYAEALRVYREMEKAGSHWMLFYNMGNCCYKLQQWVPAKIYYLKARRLNPFDPSTRKNIEIVDKRLKEAIPTPKPDFISRVAMRLEAALSLDVISIGLFLVVVILNGFVFILMKKGKSRFLLYGVSFSLILAVLVAGYHIYRVEKFNRGNTAVIIKEEAQLRSGPGENNTVLFKVTPGLEVKIIDRSVNRDWYQVSASAEIAGWIEAEAVHTI